MVGLERATDCFENPVFPDDDGLELLPYDGDCLTFEGEINKMAVNVAFGRQMCGVHYRMDSEEGLRLGEIVGVRLLQQVIHRVQPGLFKRVPGDKCGVPSHPINVRFNYAISFFLVIQVMSPVIPPYPIRRNVCSFEAFFARNARKQMWVA